MEKYRLVQFSEFVTVKRARAGKQAAEHKKCRDGKGAGTFSIFDVLYIYT